MPVGSEVDVIVTPFDTVRLNAFVVDSELVSTTRTENVVLPALVGVPINVPPLVSVIPDGSAPEVRDHV